MDIEAAIKHIPHTVNHLINFFRNHFFPFIIKITVTMKNELVKIHNRQNMIKRLKASIASDSIGLFISMLTASYVGDYFLVGKWHNMWGAFSNRALVSESSYIAICFALKFTVALVVFTLVRHYTEEFRTNRNRRRAQLERY